jgi:hypothetical protein
LSRLERLAPVPQAAVLGACLIFGIVAIRMLFAFPVVFGSWRSTGIALGVLAVATTAGALGGVAYGVLGYRARRVPRIGPYLAGIVVVFAYVLPLLFAFSFEVPELVRTVHGWVITLVVSLFFGVIVGHSWFREPSPRG